MNIIFPINIEVLKFSYLDATEPCRFALGKISDDFFEKHGSKLKAQIDENIKQLLNLPSKKSNHQKLLKKFFEIAENPCEFYKSLNYNDKRVFQNILFPEGFKFSLKKKECRTNKVNMIFDLTNSFKANYIVKKEKTQIQNVLESCLVAGTGFISLRAKKWALGGAL